MKSIDLDQAVIVALGSNLGDSEALLETALARLPDAGLTLVARSRWWRSAAWPDRRQPPFLNGIAIVKPERSEAEVLLGLLSIEVALGRQRSVLNAPRTVDLDLIAYGRRVVDTPNLMLPHPRAHERRFVMGPLAEILPLWIHPVLGETASTLAAAATVGTDAEPA